MKGCGWATKEEERDETPSAGKRYRVVVLGEGPLGKRWSAEFFYSEPNHARLIGRWG